VRVARSPRIALALFCLNCLILSTAALANDYYVAPTGNDSSAGSQSSPWKTIQKCINSFALGANGAVCHVADGTYQGVDITRGGSSSSMRFVLQCDGGADSATAAKNHCKIPNTVSFANFGIAVEANNVDIVGFDIGNNPNMGTAIVAMCNPNGSVVPCTTGNSVHIIGNYGHDLGSNVSSSSGVVGCPEDGVFTGGAHGHTYTDPQIIRNFVARFGITPAPAGCNVAQGIYFGNVPAGSLAIVQNNIVVAVPVSGITNSDGMCDFVISNNTIINTKHGIILSGGNFACPGGVVGGFTIANNAIFASTGTGSVFNVSSVPDCATAAPVLWSHNISDGATVDFSPARLSCDSITPNGWMHINPTSFFVNYQADGSGDYHLAAESLGIGAGSVGCVSGGPSPCTPTTDFDRTLRSASVSLGAYDVSQSGSLPSAPTGLSALVQ
jgi:hypothetical protein